jgi:hypothetical protein
VVEVREGLEAILETINLVGKRIENANVEINDSVKSLHSLKTLVEIMIKEDGK